MSVYKFCNGVLLYWLVHRTPYKQDLKSVVININITQENKCSARLAFHLAFFLKLMCKRKLFPPTAQKWLSKAGTHFMIWFCFKLAWRHKFLPFRVRFCVQILVKSLKYIKILYFGSLEQILKKNWWKIFVIPFLS